MVFLLFLVKLLNSVIEVTNYTYFMVVWVVCVGIDLVGLLVTLIIVGCRLVWVVLGMGLLWDVIGCCGLWVVVGFRLCYVGLFLVGLCFLYQSGMMDGVKGQVCVSSVLGAITGTSPVNSVDWSEDGNTVVGVSGTNVDVVDVATRAVVGAFTGHTEVVSDVAFFSDSIRVFMCTL